MEIWGAQTAGNLTILRLLCKVGNFAAPSILAPTSQHFVFACLVANAEEQNLSVSVLAV